MLDSFTYLLAFYFNQSVTFYWTLVLSQGTKVQPGEFYDYHGYDETL